MKTIYKYEIIRHGDFTIPLPQGAKILKVHPQGKTHVMWALVETGNDLEMRSFATRGTGWEISNMEKMRYIDTYFEHNESLVWHLFEIMM